MKQILLLLFAVGVTYGCSQSQQGEVITNEQISEYAIPAATISEDQGIKHIDFSNRTWNGRTWHQYESMGNPDTALTLYAYRIICTGESPDYTEPETHINLYHHTDKVKELMHSLFKSENNISLISKKLDSINDDFVVHANREVQAEIDQYGISDGPLFEFAEGLKNNNILVPTTE